MIAYQRMPFDLLSDQLSVVSAIILHAGAFRARLI
jgi:hypothetical protein